MFKDPISFLPSPIPAQQPPHSRKAKASLPPGTAPANRSQNDRHALAPLPLSEREQQVCDYLSQGVTFEAIARHLNCSPAAARAYHRRALDKRQRTIALASLEQGDRNALAQPEPAGAADSQVHRGSCHSGDERSPQQCQSSASDRPPSALPNRCERSPFHSPAVEAPALLERPNPLDLYVSSLFVTGDRVANGEYVHGRSHSPQTTTTETPRHPRRKCSSRRSRRAGVGFRVAAAS